MEGVAKLLSLISCTHAKAPGKFVIAASALLSNQTIPHSSGAHADTLTGPGFTLASLSEYNEQRTEMPVVVVDPL
jgi:hypothetical protein